MDASEPAQGMILDTLQRLQSCIWTDIGQTRTGHPLQGCVQLSSRTCPGQNDEYCENSLNKINGRLDKSGQNDEKPGQMGLS